MKSFARSIPFKILLYLLTAVFLTVFAASATGAVALEATRFFDRSREGWKETLMSPRLYQGAAEALYRYRYNAEDLIDVNLRFAVYDEEGALLLGEDLGDSPYQKNYDYYYWKEVYFTAYGRQEDSYWDLYEEGAAYFDGYSPEQATEHLIIVSGYAENPVNGGDLYFIDKGVDLIFSLRPWLGWAALSSLVLTLGTTVVLCCVAGRKKETDGPVLVGLNKIPFDLFLALFAGAGVGLGFLAVVVVEYSSLTLWLLCLPFLAWAIALLIVGIVGSLAARIKYGGIWKRTLIGRILVLLIRGIRKASMRIGTLLRGMPAAPKTVCIAGTVAVANILIGALFRNPAFFLILTAESLIGFFLTVAVALGLNTLQKHAKAIAEGDLKRKIDTTLLPGPMKKHGETLNRIGDGLNTAVGERIKSERMKTELITNVSHDIKTPLTSIINYVDLLSKEKMSKTAGEYLQILQRQSARLKKLTDDVVEASKASSGAIVLEPEPCDLGVLLEQAVGEYEDLLKEKDLQMILKTPETETVVFADGRQLWRVFENLMSNICKYSLPGTRVYLTLGEDGENATVAFRNISKDPLTAEAEELTERFVRADTSRHSEGSGLGLSIARSLTELQGGTFGVEADGDLFKATIKLPLMKR